MLFKLGFERANLEVNYECNRFPVDPARLAAVTEKVFREALSEPEDFGVAAMFNQPDLADAFYLGWSIERPQS